MEAAKIEERPSLVITRNFPVAREKVWAAWTDPEALKKWWGPADEPVSVLELELRVGGRFHVVFGGPHGRANEVLGVCKQVVAPERLSFTWTWPRTTPDRESLVTLTLRSVAGGTELTLSHERFFDEVARSGHEQGWLGSLARLERMLAAGAQTR
jgi:uncharacterized protein YndB with AHSA1/START domain